MFTKNRIAAATAACFFAVLGASQAQADVLTVNVAGITSVGEVGDAANTLRSFNIGAGSRITGISYNVNLTAFSPSYLSEIGLYFSDTAQSTGIFFTPGFDTPAPGTATYADSADLVALGLAFNVGSNGILRLEFFEDFDDFAGADGIWNSGTISFTYTPTVVTAPVPEPETYALMLAGLGALGWAAARRRRAAV